MGNKLYLSDYDIVLFSGNTVIDQAIQLFSERTLNSPKLARWTHIGLIIDPATFNDTDYTNLIRDLIRDLNLSKEDFNKLKNRLDEVRSSILECNSTLLLESTPYDYLSTCQFN